MQGRYKWLHFSTFTTWSNHPKTVSDEIIMQDVIQDVIIGITHPYMPYYLS